MKQPMMKETGFDATFDSQQVFRLLLDSMSRPGKINTLKTHPFTRTPAGLNPYVLSILKTLGDNYVTFGVSKMQARLWQDYLELNTGTISDTVYSADYVLFSGSSFAEDFLTIKTGSPEFPEDSATAIITVEDLEGETDAEEETRDCTLILSGPGIKTETRIKIKGLDKVYGQTILEKNCDFPLGIDMILLDQKGRLTCIPRTTKMEVI